MKYACVKNGKIVDGPRGLPSSWGNISGFNRLSNEELFQHGWLPWELVEISSPGSDWVQDMPDIKIDNTKIIETQTYRLKTQDEKNEEKRQHVNQNKRARENAYREISDPIFFKAQRGEATMEQWLASVEQIKQQYPKE